MKYFYLILSLIVMAYSCNVEKSNTDYINPMIGAVTYGEKTQDIHGFGKTFPGAATPFGLVQLSPDTRTGGDNGPGYSWNHPTIEGFSFTHMSGIGWNGDLGNFLVMPTTGKLFTNKGWDDIPEEGYRSRYSHDDETAEAGYYNVLLQQEQLKVLKTVMELSEDRYQYELNRQSLGGSVTYNVLQAKNVFLNDKANYMNQEVIVRNAVRTLNFMIGEAPAQTWTFTEPFEADTTAYVLGDLLSKMKSGNQTLKNQYTNLLLQENETSISRCIIVGIRVDHREGILGILIDGHLPVREDRSGIVEGAGCENDLVLVHKGPIIPYLIIGLATK